MSLAEGFRYQRLQEAIGRLIDEFGAYDVIDAARAIHQERRDAEYGRYREERDSAIAGRSTAKPER